MGRHYTSEEAQRIREAIRARFAAEGRVFALPLDEGDHIDREFNAVAVCGLSVEEVEADARAAQGRAKASARAHPAEDDWRARMAMHGANHGQPEQARGPRRAELQVLSAEIIIRPAPRREAPQPVAGPTNTALPARLAIGLAVLWAGFLFGLSGFHAVASGGGLTEALSGFALLVMTTGPVLAALWIVANEIC